MSRNKSENRVCVDCGVNFTLTEDEIEFYKSNDLTLPKRCKKCRNERKNNVYADLNEVSKDLGLRKSSFIVNAQLFGMPTNVAGGLSTEYVYLIEVEREVRGGLLKGYYFEDCEQKKSRIVSNMSVASHFKIRNEAITIIHKLQHNKSFKKVKLVSISYYVHLRE